MEIAEPKDLMRWKIFGFFMHQAYGSKFLKEICLNPGRLGNYASPSKVKIFTFHNFFL